MRARAARPARGGAAVTAVAAAVTVAVGALVLGVPRAALAKDPPADYEYRNVAVLPFIGDDADKFEAAVKAIIFAHKRMKKADADNLAILADKAGVPLVDLRAGTGLNKFCPGLRIDAVVVGEVVADGKKYDLSLKVFDGETGDLLGASDYPGLKSPKLEKKTTDEILDRVVKGAVRYAYAGPEPGKSRPPSGDGDKGDGDADKGDGDKGDGDGGDGDRHHDDGDGGDGRDDDGGDGDGESGPSSRPARHPGSVPWLAASAGLAGLSRRIDIVTTAGGQPPFLAPSPFVGLTVSANARPLVLFLDGPVTGLGVMFDFVVGFPSARFKEGTTPVRIPNGYLELGGGAFYRVALLDEKLEILPHVGYWLYSVPIRNAEMRSLESFSYSSVRMGVDGAYTVIPKLRFDAGFSYDLVLTVGRQAVAFYGAPGTSGKGLGFEGHLGGGYELLDFLRVGGRFFVEYHHARFAGLGASNLTDVAARDLALGLLVTATYLLK